MIKACVNLALAGTLTSSALAHDFWLEPSATRVVPGQAATFRLLVGDGFPGEPRPRPEHLQRFEVVDPAGVASAIEGLPGEDPAGSARLSRAGIHVVAYHGKPVRIELAAERFESYLAHAGLERISELRAERGATALPGRERYSRCAKALVAVGEAGGAGFERAVGLPLELVPQANPLALRPGDQLAVRALLRGVPLPGLTILAFARDGGNRARVRTDTAGRATFLVDRAGSWMLSGVHMWEADGSDADWESVWTSLTFVVAGP